MQYILSLDYFLFVESYFFFNLFFAHKFICMGVDLTHANSLWIFQMLFRKLLENFPCF